MTQGKYLHPLLFFFLVQLLIYKSQLATEPPVIICFHLQVERFGCCCRAEPRSPSQLRGRPPWDLNWTPRRKRGRKNPANPPTQKSQMPPHAWSHRLLRQTDIGQAVPPPRCKGPSPALVNVQRDPPPPALDGGSKDALQRTGFWGCPTQVMCRSDAGLEHLPRGTVGCPPAAESFSFAGESVLFQGGFSCSERQNWKAGRKPGRKNCKTGVGRRGDLDQKPPSSLTGRQLGESMVWK